MLSVSTAVVFTFIKHTIYGYVCVVNAFWTDPPVISRVSPQQVTWVSGNDGKIQVLFEGGFPEPNVIWTRQLTDSSQQETLNNDGNNVLFSGLYSLNLTVTNVTLADTGNYSITVLNYLGSETLLFRVDVISMCMHEFRIKSNSVKY